MFWPAPLRPAASAVSWPGNNPHDDDDNDDGDQGGGDDDHGCDDHGNDDHSNEAIGDGNEDITWFLDILKKSLFPICLAFL